MDYNTVIASQPVVIDNGSGILKAGFAGENAPKCIFGNYVGRPKHTRVMAGALEGDCFIGPKAQEYRGLLALKYPMEHGIVTDWSDMEKIWQYIYSSDQLRTEPNEHPILLTEAPLNPQTNREKAAEILFETFNVPALYIQIQAVLSLYSSGRTTGVVLDSGDGVTHVVPIFEGFAIEHGIQRIDIAGRDVTRYLRLLLRKEGHIFSKTSEFEIVREIKEQKCKLYSTPLKEDSVAGETTKVIYPLPDGSKIEIGAAHYRAPEILFRPELIGEECDGVAHCLSNAIFKCDVDLRKKLYENIVLSGGSTMFQGFGDRLLTEMRRLGPKDAKIRILAPQERIYSTWIGGSILASLDTFRKIWVTKQQFDSIGKGIIARKTF
ncbi:unnamed protein product [Meloidogyne enterolobii]|uniref:Uncharacterized protein n=5 Tax=Meloidogyne TaxID=189290 RepID=A0A6V7VLM3_MELEN|nr:unnamed protein product [Meloidogyne enterolobii]CAD2175866.1 unnamed protein product [Meloidogyne enterolobii]CAD2182702.1 unnamed protein product [Meloidogyne enterolobii]CAD2198324.1 unnamed protein product [Meloidogyne enterolobii]